MPVREDLSFAAFAFLRGRVFGGIRLSVSYRVSVVPLAVSLRATHNSELRTHGLVAAGEASLKVQHLKECYTKAPYFHPPVRQALTRIVTARITSAKLLSYSVTLHLQPFILILILIART